MKQYKYISILLTQMNNSEIFKQTSNDKEVVGWYLSIPHTWYKLGVKYTRQDIFNIVVCIKERIKNETI